MTVYKMRRLYKVIAFVLFLVLKMNSEPAFSQSMRSDKWQNDIPNFAFHDNARGLDFLKKGFKYLDQKQPDKARTEFNKALRPFRDAIKRKNDYYAANFNLSLAYYLRNTEGDRKLAMDSFATTIKIAESQKIRDPALYNTVGKIHFEVLNYDEAERSFKKSLEIDKDYPEAMNNLAAVYERKGDVKAALEQYRKARSLGSMQAGDNYQRLSPLRAK